MAINREFKVGGSRGKRKRIQVVVSSSATRGLQVKKIQRVDRSDAETAYLLGHEANAAHLRASIAQLRAGQTHDE